MNGQPDQIDAKILELVHARGKEKTICPSEVARALAGSNEKEWRLLMKPIRARAIALAQVERIEIRRKGKLADPENFKGVYRLATRSQ
ncbi:MAG: DUF3253 domain-containing protein [Hyphomicrobiales bacterium]